MDPTQSGQQLVAKQVSSGDIVSVVKRQESQIAQLTSLVEGQNTRLSKMSSEFGIALETQNTRMSKALSEFEIALSAAQLDRSELRVASQGTVASLSHISDQLNSLTAAITQNPLPPAQPGSVPLASTSVSALTSPPSASPLADNSNFPKPLIYDGDLSKCRGFITQCDIYFDNQPNRFQTSESRVSFIVSLLTGRALDWAVAALKKTQSFFSDFPAFVSEFRLVFDHPPVGPDAQSKLLTISQGNRSVAEYSVEFRLLAAECNWNDEALTCAFRRGLNESIKNQILLNQPDSLAALITLSLFVDSRLRSLRIEKQTNETPTTLKDSPDSRAPNLFRSPPTRHKPQFSKAKFDEPEPMQLGRSRLSREERQHRIRNRLCLYCGASDHLLETCTVRPKDMTR